MRRNIPPATDSLEWLGKKFRDSPCSLPENPQPPVNVHRMIDPAELVYWRRRAVAVAAILGIVLLVIWAVSGPTRQRSRGQAPRPTRPARPSSRSPSRPRPGSRSAGLPSPPAGPGRVAGVRAAAWVGDWVGGRVNAAFRRCVALRRRAAERLDAAVRFGAAVWLDDGARLGTVTRDDLAIRAARNAARSQPGGGRPGLPRANPGLPGAHPGLAAPPPGAARHSTPARPSFECVRLAGFRAALAVGPASGADRDVPVDPAGRPGCRGQSERRLQSAGPTPWRPASRQPAQRRPARPDRA